MKSKLYPFKIDNTEVLIESTEVFLVSNDEDEPLTVSKADDASDRKFQNAIDLIKGVSKSLQSTISSIKSDELEIEMGISFAGKYGLPFIASTSTEASLKVTIKWKKETKDE